MKFSVPIPRIATVSAGLLLLLSALALLSTGASAYSGGAASENREYNCGGSCHSVKSDSRVSMTASDLTPGAGQQITVTVTVRDAEGVGGPMGVFLVTKFTAGDSLPSVDGWTILTDPSGDTAYNYHLDVNAPPGVKTFTWTLKAPAKAGTYELYAREHHGGGSTYYRDDQTGIRFTVSGGGGSGGEDDNGSGGGNPTALIILGAGVVAVVAGFFLFLGIRRWRENTALAKREERKGERGGKGPAPGMIQCPECGCDLKKKNLKSHLNRVHS